MHYFFKLRWARSGSHRKCVRTRCAKLVLLHSIGSVGLVVHSGLSVVQNIDAPFFIPWWAWSVSHTKSTMARYVEQVFLTGHVVRSGAFRV
jgi:hypothetical protein